MAFELSNVFYVSTLNRWEFWFGNYYRSVTYIDLSHYFQNGSLRRHVVALTGPTLSMSSLDLDLGEYIVVLEQLGSIYSITFSPMCIFNFSFENEEDALMFKVKI